MDYLGKYDKIEEPKLPAETTSESCIIFSTDDNRGRIKIQLHFQSTGVVDLGEQYIGNDEHWSHCFPTGDLMFYTLQGEDRNGWTGTIHMQHGDKRAVAMMECENCVCPEGGCKEETSLHVGLDDDGTVDGEHKCLNAQSCPFRVTWTTDDRSAYRHESGNYVIYYNHNDGKLIKDSYWIAGTWFLASSEGGDAIKRLGSAKCPPGDFSGMKVATTPENAKQCNCDQACSQQCIDNPGEHSVCKCIYTGWGMKCVSCPQG